MLCWLHSYLQPMSPLDEPPVLLLCTWVPFSQRLLSRILNECLKHRWSWLHVYWTLWCHDPWSGTWGSHWLNVGSSYSTDMLDERMTRGDGQVGIGFHPASHSMNYDWKCIYLITLYSSEGSSTLLYSLFFMNFSLCFMCVSVSLWLL